MRRIEEYSFPIIMKKDKGRTYYKCEPLDEWFTYFNEYDNKTNKLKETHLITRRDIKEWISNKISWGWKMVE